MKTSQNARSIWKEGQFSPDDTISIKRLLQNKYESFTNKKEKGKYFQSKFSIEKIQFRNWKCCSFCANMYKEDTSSQIIFVSYSLKLIWKLHNIFFNLNTLYLFYKSMILSVFFSYHFYIEFTQNFV